MTANFTYDTSRWPKALARFNKYGGELVTNRKHLVNSKYHELHHPSFGCIGIPYGYEETVKMLERVVEYVSNKG